MKKLFTGMIIGALITCGVFYFIHKQKENEHQENVAELLAFVKKGQATNVQVQEAINDTSTMLVGAVPLTIIVTDSDEYYFYRDRDCSKIEKIDFAALNRLFLEEKKIQKEADLMIIIKMPGEATFKNSMGLLDAITAAGIQPGHYAAVELSELEKNASKTIRRNNDKQ